MSGSTNQSDIAERRKLEAELYEARESLNDTYYDHSMQSQQNALSAEQEAYEETMNRFVKSLRDGLDSAIKDMNKFISGVTTIVTLNADTILDKYQTANPHLSKELTDPWVAASAEAEKYKGNALDLLNQWVANGGEFSTLNASIGNTLSSPWETGSNAVNAFKMLVDQQMDAVANKIESNVISATGNLSSLYEEIKSTYDYFEETKDSMSDSINSLKSYAADTVSDIVTDLGEVEVKIGEVKDTSTTYTSSTSGGGGGGNTATTTKPAYSHAIAMLQEILTNVYMKSVAKTGYWDQNTATALAQVQRAIGIPATGKYDVATARGIEYDIKDRGTITRKSGEDYSLYTKYWKLVPVAFHAKGITSATSDHWAIVDELGPELMLRANPATGRLDYVTAGTGIIPADLTENLMEWGKLNPNMIPAANTTPNVNMINNAVNKPEFTLNVDNFLRCDNVSQDSLPELKQFVKTEMNNMIKQMNYAIKGKGGR